MRLDRVHNSKDPITETAQREEREAHLPLT